ncbi:DUF2163 domain-containing protein [Yoonia sp. BS5-3]|uniref:DUF2163 domain-containing protein n=1 Tax=Yoonia phaeophyticola TaxID=3137369 RepID=A0ABZ2V2Q9_9RHOB
MSALDLHEHLATGATHMCHCWRLQRQDGVTLGFTDHDQPIGFDGVIFQPDTGMTARALSSTTGLSVDNSEAAGVLSAAAITEADIEAGRYDEAAVSTWLVQWDQPENRQLLFSGTIGEITRVAGAFQAELRGLADPMNQATGRTYLTTCGATLGDGSCTANLLDPRYSTIIAVQSVEANQFFSFDDLSDFAVQWFDGGSLEVISGAATGLSGLIRQDTEHGSSRHIRLWEPIRAAIVPGDEVRLVTGCDKRAETCKEKFANLINFQGFPHIPGDDWLVSVPRSDQSNTGGSRNG